jgi:ribosome-associated protein
MFGPVVLRGGSVVPEDALTWRFSRSSGPGGQSVNTADSRVELSVGLAAITWATPADRDRVLARLAPRLALADRREATARRDVADDKDQIKAVEAVEAVGTVLVVVASEFRSQLRNREAALARVTELLDDALRPPPPPRRATRPSRASRARRVQAESRRRSVKELRRRPQA